MAVDITKVNNNTIEGNVSLNNNSGGIKLNNTGTETSLVSIVGSNKIVGNSAGSHIYIAGLQSMGGEFSSDEIINNIISGNTATTITNYGEDTIINGNQVTTISDSGTGTIINNHISKLDGDGTTSAASSNLVTQRGWGDIAGVVSASNIGPETVTFPTAFSSAPVVVVSGIGKTSSTPNSIDDFTTATTNVYAVTEDITASNFKVALNHVSTFGDTQNYGYSWIAIGEA